MKFTKLSTLLLLSIVLLYCTLPSTQTCHTGINEIYIGVLDPAGEPADSVQITVKEKENILNICDSYSGDDCQQPDSGMYLIMHDDVFQEFNQFESKEVSIVGEKGDLKFHQEYTFHFDGCHFRKIAGPDTVSLK